MQLKKNERHKGRRKKMASVRLDLEDSSGFSGTSHSGGWLAKGLAIIVTLTAIILILNDLGWDYLVETVRKPIHRIKVESDSPPSVSLSPPTAPPVVNEAKSLDEKDPVLPDQNQGAPTSFFVMANTVAMEQIHLAREAARIGLMGEALQLMDRALQSDPSLQGLSFMKAELYLDAKQPDDARPLLEKALLEEVTLLPASIKLGMIYAQNDQHEQAVDYFYKACKLRPRDAGLHHLLSLSLRAAGRIQEGHFEAQKAASLDPENIHLKITAQLASYQAGASEPPPSVLQWMQSPPPVEAASPYDLVLASGWATTLGKADLSRALWSKVEPFMPSMPGLKQLTNDPLIAASLTSRKTKKSMETTVPEVHEAPILDTLLP